MQIFRRRSAAMMKYLIALCALVAMTHAAEEAALDSWTATKVRAAAAGRDDVRRFCRALALSICAFIVCANSRALACGCLCGVVQKFYVGCLWNTTVSTSLCTVRSGGVVRHTLYALSTSGTVSQSCLLDVADIIQVCVRSDCAAVRRIYSGGRP